MTPLDKYLTEVEGRVEKATEGAWRKDLCFLDGAFFSKGGIEELIAHSRTDVETLLKMVRRAKEMSCCCGLYEWTESDCPRCVMCAELNRLASGEVG